MDKTELIKKLCKERGITVNALENTLDLATGTVLKMSKSKPNADKLYKIASYFGVPMEMFYDDDALTRLESYYEQIKGDYLKAKEPIYDVACGNGRINGDYAEEYVLGESEEDCSWCKVYGDSMSPILFDGDYVKVKHTTQTEPSDLTAIKVDGESTTIKFVEVVDNGIWLRAENKSVFQDKFYSVQEVLSLPITIIGKVIELKRKF